ERARVTGLWLRGPLDVHHNQVGQPKADAGLRVPERLLAQDHRQFLEGCGLPARGGWFLRLGFERDRLAPACSSIWAASHDVSPVRPFSGPVFVSTTSAVAWFAPIMVSFPCAQAVRLTSRSSFATTGSSASRTISMIAFPCWIETMRSRRWS